MRILVLHAGGLGDIILLETLFAGLRARHPDASIELLCRSAVAPAAALYERPPDAVHAFAFEPYRWTRPSAELAAEIRAYIDALGEVPVDLLLSAELRGSALGPILTWILKPAAHQIAPLDAADAIQLKTFAFMLGLTIPSDEPQTWTRAADRISDHELDRYARMAGDDALRMPQLRRVAAAPSRELLLFAAGSPDLKRWSDADLARTAETVAAQHDLIPVLIGHEREAAQLAATANAFASPPPIVTFGDDELPALAARIAGAAAFLGIDTGLAHLAAAMRIPGVTVYGGGTWPAYAPWQTRTAGVLAPIACAGCEWNCAFGRAFCIEGVAFAPVIDALQRVLGAAADDAAQVVRLDAFSTPEQVVFAAARRTHRVVDSDRRKRFGTIVELEHALAQTIEDRKNRLAVWRSIAEERGTAIDELTAAAQELTHAAEERLRLLEEATAEIERLQKTAARASGDAERRAMLLADLTAEMQKRRGNL